MWDANLITISKKVIQKNQETVAKIVLIARSLRKNLSGNSNSKWCMKPRVIVLAVFN
jgi:hypothetical protein